MKLYTKDGRVSSLNNIVLTRDGMQVINPTEEMVLADGWTEYIQPVYEPQPQLEPYEYEITSALKMMIQPQLATLSDIESAKVKQLFPTWSSTQFDEIYLCVTNSIVGYDVDLNDASLAALL